MQFLPLRVKAADKEGGGFETISPGPGPGLEAETSGPGLEGSTGPGLEAETSGPGLEGTRGPGLEAEASEPGLEKQSAG